MIEAGDRVGAVPGFIMVHHGKVGNTNTSSAPNGALTGACRPGLAENSPLDCFPCAAALLEGKAGH